MITTDKANELRDELEEVRAAWQEWTARWTEYQRTLRHAGYNTYRLMPTRSGWVPTKAGGSAWRAGSPRSSPT